MHFYNKIGSTFNNFKVFKLYRISISGYCLFPMDIRPCFHVTIHLQSLECITLIKINQPGREWFEIVCWFLSSQRRAINPRMPGVFQSTPMCMRIVNVNFCTLDNVSHVIAVISAVEGLNDYVWESQTFLLYYC